MANEGSDKPTYSELFRERNEYALGCGKLQIELARVRGLLQRQWISVEERLPEKHGAYLVLTQNGRQFVSSYVGEFGWQFPGFATPVTHWMPLLDRPNFPQSSGLVSQGAESADIGKLDTADKSGVEMGKVSSADDKAIDEQFAGMATDEKYQAETVKIEKEFAQSDWETLQGSAETGGEKAGNG